MIQIAIADDHVLFRKGIAELIEGFSGCTVLHQASNGQDMLDFLSTQTPDLIILDIQMPVLNGFETAEHIKEKHPDVKILALSMYGDEPSIIRMLKSGAKGYILKDAEPADLERAIKDVHTRGFYYSDEVGHLILSGMQGKQTAVLKDREIEFLKLACTEKTYKEIADIMCVSPRTVDGYREALFEKLEAKSRVGLVVYAIKHGLYQIT